MNQPSMLYDYFEKGGVVMWPLLLLSILALTLIIERFWFYTKAASQDRQLLKRISPSLSKRKIEDSLSIANAFTGPVAMILRSGLAKSEKGKQATEKAMLQAGSLQLVRLERALGVLSSIGNISPLLGFLGTVIGMIKAFDVIAYQGLNDPSLVAIGIKVALITTATGLIIAIPTLAAYNYFTLKVASFIAAMEEQSNNLIELLFD